MIPDDGLVVSQRDLGIRCVHLVSGEDIIGRVYDHYDEQTGVASFVILKPVMPNCSMQPSPTGMKIGVGLLPMRPFLGADNTEVEIPKAYAIYTVAVGKQMEKMYLEYTTGIDLSGTVPDTKKLLGL